MSVDSVSNGGSINLQREDVTTDVGICGEPFIRLIIEADSVESSDLLKSVTFMTPYPLFPRRCVGLFGSPYITSVSSEESVAFPVDGKTDDIRFGNPLRACDLLDFFALLRRKKLVFRFRLFTL